MIYRLSVKNYVYHWWVLVIHLAFLVGTPIYITNRYGGESRDLAMVVVALWFSLSFVPFLLLQAKYTIENLGVLLSYDPTSQIVKVASRSVERTFHVSCIDKIFTVKTRAFIRGSLLWLPWDTSCYGVILLKSGERFLITSLLIPRLEWPFTEIRESVRGSFYCWPGKESIQSLRAPAG